MAVLRREEIVDDWSALINGANGKAEEVFSAAKSLIAETEVPNVAVERREMSPGVIRRMFGTERNLQLVIETGKRRLKSRHFQIHIDLDRWAALLPSL